MTLDSLTELLPAEGRAWLASLDPDRRSGGLAHAPPETREPSSAFGGKADIDGDPSSGLLTLVEIDRIRIGSAGKRSYRKSFCLS